MSEMVKTRYLSAKELGISKKKYKELKKKIETEAEDMDVIFKYLTTGKIVG